MAEFRNHRQPGSKSPAWDLASAAIVFVVLPVFGMIVMAKYLPPPPVENEPTSELGGER